jgi:hypothetical protein
MEKKSPNNLFVTHEGILKIGNLTLPCYVLNNGQRVLSGRGVQNLLNLSSSSINSSRQPGSRLKRLFNSKAFKPFIYSNLKVDQFSMIKCYKGKTVIHGYDPVSLVDLCEVILQVKDSGVFLTARQNIIVRQAEIFMRSLAKVGIIALIDEATGYQDTRARDALQKILEKFISKELHPWVKTFPDEFYENYFRLRGWNYTSIDSSRPGVVGKDTIDLIYQRLAPAVLEELKRITPRLESGRLKHHFHRRLTDDIGHPKLREHIASVITLMKASNNWSFFKRMIDKAIPKYGQTLLLPFDEDE